MKFKFIEANPVLLSGVASDLFAMSITDTKIDLYWSSNALNQDGYKVERSIDGINFIVIYSTAPGILAFSDFGLTPSTTYYYRVRAFRNIYTQYSAYSNIATATTLDLSLYTGVFRNASTYGFSSLASGAVNRAALQTAVLGGNCNVYIEYGSGTGIYDINDTILLDSNTTLVFEQGVKLRKSASYCQVFMNRGALTKAVNENIVIDGLEILTNGNDPDSTLVLGLRGHMGFYYIKNLTIKNFKLLDAVALTTSFVFFICRFENVYMNGIQISSGRDGLDFSAGHDAIIENAILQTGDDAIGLKGIDYPALVVEVGDVYNMTFRNIIDSTAVGQSDTVGHLCRAMTASWTDWTNLNMYQIGDLAINGGNLYQVQNCNVGEVQGTVAPVHLTGDVTGADGITWRYKQPCTVYHTDIYNILFDNIMQSKNRNVFASQLYNNATYLRAVYPGTENLSAISGVRFINGYIKHTGVGSALIASCGNLKDVIIANNYIENISMVLNNQDCVPDFVSLESAVITGNIFKDLANFIFFTKISETLTVFSYANIALTSTLNLGFVGASKLRYSGTDLTLPTGNRLYLTPDLGDQVREPAGIYTYTGAGWVLTP